MIVASFQHLLVLVVIATRYGTPRVGGEIFPHPSRPGRAVHPASCTVGTGSFPGVKRQGRGVNHLPPSGAEVNPLNDELNPICYLLALLGAHHFLHVSRIRVKSLALRLLMSYIYIYIYIYMEHPFLMFLDHTQRRSTVGRTPLDE